MKRTINYLFAALTLFAAASCTKDIQPDELNDGQSELRTIELSFENSGITKVGVSDRTPQWEAGDTIWISNGASSEVKKLASDDITGNVAKISTSLSGTLYAVYPASAQNGVSDGKIGFKIPTSTDGAFGNAHISVAEGTTSLAFKNVVSILKITTETATKLVNISSASAIAGEFKVTYGTRAVEAGTAQAKGINITSSAAGEKYVAVASGVAFNALEFTVVGNTNATDWATKKSAQTSTTGINTIYDMGSVSTWSLSYITNGSIWAKFSVASGKQVRFSKGNLQAMVDDSGTPSAWNFAADQYGYIGNAVANTSIGTTAGVVDLFGWSTDATSNNWGIHTKTEPAAGWTDGNFKDWGKNPIINGGNTADQWRTLTENEWTHLLNTRTSSTVNGVKNARYCKSTVNSIAGLILFPDNYTHPAGMAAPTKVNESGTSKVPIEFTVNIYSSDDWTKMESAGCVFLPAAGRRLGSYVDIVGSYGLYCSSTPIESYGAYILGFCRDYVDQAAYGSRYNGFSVRLVCAAQ